MSAGILNIRPVSCVQFSLLVTWELSACIPSPQIFTNQKLHTCKSGMLFCYRESMALLSVLFLYVIKSKSLSTYSMTTVAD